MEKAVLTLAGKLTSSSVAEDKNTESAGVTTVFEGEIKKGDLEKYDPDLEEVVFQSHCWQKIKTVVTEHQWIMQVHDPKNKVTFAQINGCLLDDLSVKVGKKGDKSLTLSVTLVRGKEQDAVEAGVSTQVVVKMIPDKEVLKGLGDEKVDRDEKDKKPVPPAEGSV
jgi:hypothetical protein